MRGLFFFTLVITIFTASFFALANRTNIRDFIVEYQKTSLPEAIPYNSEKLSGPNSDSYPDQALSVASYTNTHDREQLYKISDGESLPDVINLAVPFTSQAPHANWDLPYKETCEEASLLMVARYKNGEAINSPEDADREIWKLINFQNELFGDYKDTTAEQTAEIARKYYGFENTEVMYDFTVDDIKRGLAKGNPVIVPAAGRQLGNSYFRRPGPLYHMLVIRGYTKDKFITNDPGTKRGEEFVYTYDDLLSAVHDWNGGEVESGRRVMIVVR